jgi:sterol 14alpha-demethylase
MFELTTSTTICIVVGAVIVLGMLFGSRRPKNAPPNAHVGLPLIGNYIEFASNPVAFVKKCMDKFGSVYTVPMLHKKLTFLLHPDVTEKFYKSDDEIMSQPEVYSFMTPVFGKNVVYDAKKDKRVQQMQRMATGLNRQRLASYVEKIEKETIDYLKNWKESGQVNLLDALSELTIMTASRCLHGDDVRENMFNEVARIYHDLDKGVTPLSFFFPYAPTAAHKIRDKARAEMVEIFSKVIRARREKGVDSSKSTDILQVFMDLKYRDGTVPTEDEIVGLLIALLFAGQHTSSVTSTWTVMFLIHKAKCLEAMMAEQQKVLSGDMKKPLDFDLVGNMEYLQSSVKEALRMHPPLILLMRMAMKDVSVTTKEGNTFVIPKGDIVVTSPAVSSRLEDVFKNPNEFEPERFMGERDEEKAKQFAFVGFGGGLHACMGQQFGLLQVKTLVSVLLRNFEITPVESAFPEPDYAAMVVGPKNHLMVNYKKRPDAFI